MASQNVLKNVPLVEEINNHLKNEFLTISWLQKKTDITYHTLYGIFNEFRVPLTQERLNLINHALRTSFKFKEHE